MNHDASAPHAIVIGGGIAGLSVAYELQRQNIPFVVLERRGRAGGVILSEEIDGYTIDAPRDMWMYRDWVIQSLNKDQPFDQFVIDGLQMRCGDFFHKLVPYALLSATIPERGSPNASPKGNSRIG